MMISPEGYYEMELKGKPAEDIARKIRGLKNKIGHLKKTVENPDYGTEPVILPTPGMHLWCTRQYLERAIAAYEEAGGSYKPSQAEQRAAEFDAAIPTIAKVTFSIGTFFGGQETRTITLTENDLQMDIDRTVIPEPTEQDTESEDQPTKDEFLEELRDIHIGEWRRYYDASDYGVIVLDGTQWELTIEYADSRQIKHGGSNAYPFSFDALCELIGYKRYDENEDIPDDQ